MRAYVLTYKYQPYITGPIIFIYNFNPSCNVYLLFLERYKSNRSS